MSSCKHELDVALKIKESPASIEDLYQCRAHCLSLVHRPESRLSTQEIFAYTLGAICLHGAQPVSLYWLRCWASGSRAVAGQLFSRANSDCRIAQKSFQSLENLVLGIIAIASVR
jgi:hypothetical protein